MDQADLLNEFVEEATEHLSDIEIQLLQIEAMGEDVDDGLVNTVFRAIHSVKGAAGFLGLTQINELSHHLEDVLGRVREGKLTPDPYNVDVMLKSADRLKTLIDDVETSNASDNSELCEKLKAVLDGAGAKSDSAAAGNSAESQLDEVSHRIEEATAPEPPDEAQGDQAEHVLETNEDPAPAQAPAASNGTVTPARSSAKKTDDSGADSKATRRAPESTIRVGVRVLDRLMNLAGELVLSRNQLMQTLAAISLKEDATRQSSLDKIALGLDQVTTELQETIMQTRMQPIGNVFNKFPRVIRDLSASLGKEIQLKTEGNEVETDKTIVEAIADPLTHLIRNSCDHGIESPDVRTASGKDATGSVVLKAYHQAGKVMIEIIDDGAGMDPEKLRRKAVEKGVLSEEAAARMSDADAVNLIFAPGFSTAAAVTDVSGRGVGMDVVRTNIEKIGGSVEVTSKLGAGSTVSITLPLTLAIIPAMIVEVSGHRYALPQSSIAELVQTDGKEKCIQQINHAEVLKLRGKLLPLVRLREVLGLNPGEEGDFGNDHQLVVLETGRCRCALAVDRVIDSEEIVVKPLGRHLNELPMLAGSTILGDGHVAMILDASGVAIDAEAHDSAASMDDAALDGAASDLQRLVLISVSPNDHFAIPMDIVSRIERINRERVEMIGSQRLMQYRGGTLPLLNIEDVVEVTQVDDPDESFVIVFKVCGHEAGLQVPYLEDIRDCDLNGSLETLRQTGVAGVAIIGEHSTRMLDLYGLTEVARPEWFESMDSEEAQTARILVCEDSAFFRNFLTRVLAEQGHEVTACEHGEEGWATLSERPKDFDLLVTDVEMPELSGIELTKRVRADGRFQDLPVIALTSLADEDSRRVGKEAGVNDYQVKMNKPELLASIDKLTAKTTSGGTR
ncbi:MAG: chemotaxis protein CheW [Planctomycetota bacterium]